MSDPSPPTRRPGAEAAEDLIDAATGLDGRAWVTLRDLVVRPFEMMGRAAFEHDPTYVGAVKFSLALTTLVIVLMSWLFPSDAPLTSMAQSDPAGWASLNLELQEQGICFAHFADRFSNRYELLNTTATLFECGLLALVLHRFDRGRPLLSHLSFALYAYALWLVLSIPCQLGIAATGALGLSSWVSTCIALLMVVALPAILITGMLRLYPASWPRQLVRALLLLLVICVLFAAAVVVISAASLAWARASFGM